MCLLLIGCGKGGKQQLNLYCDIDKATIEPLIKEFEKERNIEAKVVYADPKTVQSGEGLSSEVRGKVGEVDIYWANSLTGLWKLRDDDSLYSHPVAANNAIYHRFRDTKRGTWFGVNARVRVLLYPKGMDAKQRPLSLASLRLGRWKGRCGIADPRTNDSSFYHLLYYYTVLNPNEARHLVEEIKANQVQLLPDENAVVEAVVSGKLAWGIVDSDLAMATVKAGKPVAYAVADQGGYATVDALEKTRGTLPSVGTPIQLSPVMILKNTPHDFEAKQFYEFMLTSRAIRRLGELQPFRQSVADAMLIKDPPKDDPKAIHLLGVLTRPLELDTLNANRGPLTTLLVDVFGQGR